MKPLHCLAVLLSICTLNTNAQLLSETIGIEGLEGKLTFTFDTITAKKGKAFFVYENGGTVIRCGDSAFTDMFSEREMSLVLKEQQEALFKKLTGQKDSAKIKTALPPIVRFAVPGWYKQIREKLGKKESSSALVSNVNAFAIENDSMKASFVPTCNLRVYKVDPEEGKNYPSDSAFDGTIPIKQVRMWINDGYIYTFNFDIDTAKLHAKFKGLLQEHQVFSVRYNLRQNLMAKGMLFNTPGVKLKRKHTHAKGKGSGYVFYMYELVDYLAPKDAPGNIFTARDTVMTFSACSVHSFDSVKVKEKSLYSIINLDLFGDLIGFFGADKPNGLLQTEVKASFYGFRRPLRQRNPFPVRFTFLNKGELFFRFSKLDNKNRYLPVLTDSVKRMPAQSDTAIKYVHGYRLLEFQNIYAGLRINLGDFEYRGGGISFPVELAFLRTPMSDTLFKTIEKQGRVDTVLSPVNYGKNSLLIVPGVNINFKAASYLDIDLHSRLFIIHPLTKNIKLSKSEFDELYGKNPLVEVRTPTLLNLGAVITVNLNSDKSRRVIIRGENYIDTRQRGNNFWQAQVGYSADLNKFISLNNPAKTN